MRETSLDLLSERLQKERQHLKRSVILDSIEVSRESIKVFTKLIDSMPSLADDATELIFLEQSNITKDFEDLVSLIKEQEV